METVSTTVVQAGQSELSSVRDAHQMLDAFVLQTLREGGGEGLHMEALWAALHCLQLMQTVDKVVVRVAGNVHVPQGEVHSGYNHHTAAREEENTFISATAFIVFTTSRIHTIESKC